MWRPIRSLEIPKSGRRIHSAIENRQSEISRGAAEDSGRYIAAEDSGRYIVPVDQQTIGLIAGAGVLPVLTARGIRAAGHRVVCIGLNGQVEPELPPLCAEYASAGIARPNRWIRLLRRWGAGDTVMVGKVRKTTMYDPLKFVRYLPDWRAIRLWYVKLRHDRRTDRMLGALADELASEGIVLIDTTKYIPEHMAGEGPMTRCRPTESQLADVAFALPIAQRMGDLDVGQAIAVKDREVIAVEAIEGTDAMIARAGGLCRKGAWTLVKLAKPRQDMRFDVPTVGVSTIESLKRAGGTCLAVEAGKVILLDKPAFLAAAEQAGVAVVGVKV